MLLGLRHGPVCVRASCATMDGVCSTYVAWAFSPDGARARTPQPRTWKALGRAGAESFGPCTHTARSRDVSHSLHPVRIGRVMPAPSSHTGVATIIPCNFLHRPIE